MNREPIHYLQTDSRWRTVPYAVKGEASTIGSAGCGPTCAAMVIATLKSSRVNPMDTARWSLKNGYKALNQGTFYTYFPPQFQTYEIQCKRLNSATIYGKTDSAARAVSQAIKKNLTDGNYVIACMGKGNWTRSGHYVLAWDLVGDTVKIKDPNSTAAARLSANVDTWIKQIKYAWRVEVPQTTSEDDEMIELRKIEIDGKTIEMPVIFKNGSNYVSIKSFAEHLGFKVGNDGSMPIISANGLKAKVNGEDVVIKGLNLNGSTYGNIRDLCEKIGAHVSWDSKTNSVVIDY